MKPQVLEYELQPKMGVTQLARQRTLLLLSGGVESAVLVSQLLEMGSAPVPLFADYAQRGARAEHQAARAICASAGLPEPQILDLRAEGSAHQKLNRLHIPLPHRNLALLSLALGWATTHGCGAIALGLNRDDFGKDAVFKAAGAVRYTTGTVEFVERFESLAGVVAPDVAIRVPQASLSKADVVREGLRLGVPLTSTYSCMRGRAVHCGARFAPFLPASFQREDCSSQSASRIHLVAGTCLQCRSRRRAFEEARASDVVYEAL